MRNVIRRLLLTTALAAAPAPALAATTVYSGQDVNPGPGLAIPANPNANAANASFQSALSGTSTQGFESIAPGTGAPLALSFTGSAGMLNATLSGSGVVRNNPRSSPTGSGQFAVVGNRYFEIDGTAFTVSFTTPIAAFGFYGADLETLGGINVTLNYAAGGNQAYNLATVFGPPPGGNLASGSVHFLGFIDVANPFSSVVFSGTGASGDILAFDQLTIGDPGQVTNPPVIPEPAVWASMILGFGVVGTMLRTARRRRSAVLS